MRAESAPQRTQSSCDARATAVLSQQTRTTDWLSDRLSTPPKHGSGTRRRRPFTASWCGGPGGDRTHDHRFKSTLPLGDVERQPRIYGVLMLNRTDVQVHRITSVDVRTVPDTVPSEVRP